MFQWPAPDHLLFLRAVDFHLPDHLMEEVVPDKGFAGPDQMPGTS